MTWLTTASRRPRSNERGPAFGASMTIDEIAKVLGVSPARVGQIMRSALRKLRRSGASLREWLTWSIERETKRDAPGCSQKRASKGAA